LSNVTYATLMRQSGLRSELEVVANNLANLSTSGYRREGVIFSEHVAATGSRDLSLSMARAEGRIIDRSQGPLTRTGGDFAFAIEGQGYFLIETPDGERLTRAGAFQPGPTSELVTPDGYRLLDAGGAPVFIPPDAEQVKLAPDGTLSANGRELTRIGLYQPPDGASMTREAGLRFDPGGAPEPLEGDAAKMVQGFLEDSNVDAILEVARMIEVQRAYERGQKLMSSDHEMLRSMIETLGK